MKRVLLVFVVACGSVEDHTSKSGLPTVTAVSPDHGSIEGGAMIELTGTGFASDTIVLVGDKLATDVNVAGDTDLTFTLPAGEQEGAAVDVTVASSNGFGTAANAFTYNLRPVILAVNPTAGRAIGGTTVTITGRGFSADDAGTTTVTIAGTTATNVQVVDDKTITATLGASPPDALAFVPGDVSVTNSNGAPVLPSSFKLTKQGLILLDQQSRLFFADPTNGASIQLGQASRRISACALEPNTGELFVALSRDPQTQFRALGTMDAATGVVTTGATVTDSVDPNITRSISSMVFIGDNLFVEDVGNCCQGPPSDRLVQVALNSGVATVIGATATLQTNTAIGFRDATTVFFAAASNGTLDSVSTATSTRTPALPLTGGSPGGPRVRGLVNVGGTMFLAEQNSPGAVIFSVNLGTGAMTKKAQVFMTNGSVISMCQTPPSF